MQRGWQGRSHIGHPIPQQVRPHGCSLGARGSLVRQPQRRTGACQHRHHRIRGALRARSHSEAGHSGGCGPAQVTTLQIRRPDDWHVHLRDGEALRAVAPFTAAQFARAIVMPNLKPPVTSVAQALEYRQRILAALPPGSRFEPLMTLYLTDRTDPQEVDRAKASGCVHGFKLYPAGATTHSDAGVTDIRRLDAVLARMSELDVVLQVHGEVTDPSVDVFERESRFIDSIL